MDTKLLVTNARIMTPAGVLERGWLLCEGCRIALIGVSEIPDLHPDESIDAHGLTLLPGFIDVHVHGGNGYEVMDGKPEALRALAKFYAQYGVTSFLATTWTESRQAITAALEVAAELNGPQPDGATILGVHLEGPYLNEAKRGAQNPAHFRRAGHEEALTFLDFNVIRLVTVAPEFEENQWFIRECVRRGVTVSLGHTASSYEQVKEAVKMGVTHATHTYNAMVGLGHRDPGTLGAVLTTPEINCELIADNIHVHPAAMQILYASKGPDRTVLITDAIRGAGLGDGVYNIDDRQVIVKDGAVRLLDGTLAGSTLTMNRGLHNLMQATGQPLQALWKTSSLNAARTIHVADHKGSLEIGKDADLVLVDDEITVHFTVAEGRVVFRKQ